MSKPNEIKLEILDCTIRDGGYVNNWDFDEKLVRETYRALSKAGVDYVELGYHGSEKYFDKKKYGAFRFCAAQDIQKICQGIDGAKVSLMVDYGKFDLTDLSQYKETLVSLIRLAFHKDKLKDALHQATRVKRLGFDVSINLMGFSSYDAKERKELLSQLKELPIDCAYIADTYGSMIPDQLVDFYQPLIELKHIKWGFHPHNNLQMAFANSLAAIKAGVSMIDGSVFGMGRGAGNLPTEIMLAYLHQGNPDKYNVIPVLNLIDRYYSELHRQYNWGYNLPYMLSGTYGCHPDYAKNLVERKEYDIEDIWNILEVIKAKAPVGFNKDLVKEILKKGFFGKKTLNLSRQQSALPSSSEKIKARYVDRHKGRDFLILANGPSLKKNQSDIFSFIKKYNPIVLGGNYLGGLFKPHYHAFVNKRRFTDYIESVYEGSKLLVSQHIPEEIIKEYVSREYEIIYYEDTLSNPFAIKNSVISSSCRTISVLLVAVALVMGAKRVFIAGMDGYMGTPSEGVYHFYKEKNEAENIDDLRAKHNWNLKFLKQIDNYMIKHGGEGIHILTPTNYKEFYKGIKNYI